MTNAFEKMKLCFGKLEVAQDENEEDDYLMEPADRYQKVMIAFEETIHCRVEERNFKQEQV